MSTVGQASVRIVADARGFSRDAQQSIQRELNRVDTDGASRGLARRMGQSMRSAMSSAGSLGAGGLYTAFRLALVPLILSLIALLPGLGAAAAGALVFGFGGVIAGIGIFAAAQSEKVRDAFKELAKNAKSIFKEISTPFEDALVQISKSANKSLGTWSKPLSKAFADMAPTVSRFADDLIRAFESLIPAIQPLTDAFDDLLSEFGPELAEVVFPALSDALIELSRFVSENADLVSGWLGKVLLIIPAVIDVVTWLGELAAWFSEHPAAIDAAISIIVGAFTVAAVAIGAAIAAAIGSIGLIIGAVAAVATFVYRNWDEISAFLKETLDKVVNWFKETWESISNGVKEWIKFVGDRFRQMGTDIRNKFNQIKHTMITTLQSAWSTITGFFTNSISTVVEKVTGMGRSIRQGFNRVVDFFKNLPDRIGRAARGMWDGIWETFKGAINKIIGAWNGLEFTTGSIDTPLGSIGPYTLGVPKIPYLAKGGLVNRSGLAIVGEAGPELVALNRGAMVQPLPSNGGSTGGDFTVHVYIGDRELTEIVDVEIEESNERTRRRAEGGVRWR